MILPPHPNYWTWTAGSLGLKIVECRGYFLFVFPRKLDVCKKINEDIPLLRLCLETQFWTSRFFFFVFSPVAQVVKLTFVASEAM